MGESLRVISKPKKQELLVTHFLDRIKPSLKFHEDIPYGLRVIDQTQYVSRTHTRTGVKSYGQDMRTGVKSYGPTQFKN